MAAHRRPRCDGCTGLLHYRGTAEGHDHSRVLEHLPSLARGSFVSRSMITLYGFGAGFGLPEISPFVTKTEVQLKMAGLAYRKEKAKPPASPKGQLPYIVDEAETIADSTFIRAHLEAKYGFDFDAPLSLQARAQAWAFERMIEHHVYWALVGARWVDGDNFAKGPAHFFD